MKLAPPLSEAVRSSISRRRFVRGVAALGGAVATGFRPGLAEAAEATELRGSIFHLQIGETPINITGAPRMATTVNGIAPGPVLRWREGDTVTLHVTNRLKEPTSIHWHGVRSPADMDGVPGVSFGGIIPGETFTYRIPIKQSGTYWYHGHSGMQEQLGLHGAIVIEPKDGEAQAVDRDHVILLSDWTDENPMTVLSNLKMQGDYYNYGQRTVADLARELKSDGLARTWRERSLWANMRMTPTDILDVTGATYTYLVNGAPPGANWTALFQPGERVRLRVVNASAMTIFDIRIPGLAMSVVQADGCDVHPVDVDQFRIGVAETYDVIVTPKSERAYTLFAQAQDRSGYARAILAPRMGMTGIVPPTDPRPVRTMADMGMAGGDMGPAGSMRMEGMTGMDTAAGGVAMAPAAVTGPRASPRVKAVDPVASEKLRGAVNVDNLAMASRNRLGEAGDGLEHDGRRTLVYTDLKALRPGPDQRPPTREIIFHLTGNMHRWTWGFDGRTFSQAGPIRLALGERVRFILVNDTMMEHPIHLHGLFSEIENGQGENRPLKHTVTVKPGERMSYLVSADTPGRWAFHCHLLYHMEAGMFRTVVVA
jgi:CopA family copper-resistance protein